MIEQSSHQEGFSFDGVTGPSGPGLRFFRHP
jgi:hypothetical protein